MTILTQTPLMSAATGPANRAGRSRLLAWRTRLKSRQTRATLHELSDHQLRDIGLRRDQIDQFTPGR